MLNLSPKEDKFFTHFVESAKVIHESALLLQNYLEDLSNAEEKHKKIKEMEHICDLKVHETLEALNHTFLTPFDREDIYMIAKEMDNIEDFIESSAARFVMFNVNKATDESKQMAKMIVEATKELIGVMEEFKFMGKSKNISKLIIDVNRIEEEGDSVTRKAIRRLFTDDIPVLDVIKWREIYEHLENTLDSCEDVANIVEGVVMKNA